MPTPSNTTESWDKRACTTEKLVVAHHMVGYTYAYTESDWASDIAEAAAQGLDGFVLNMGVDDWQPARIADAFTAAEASSTGFKLMISLDVSSLTCATSSDVTNLRALATAHSTSAAYLTMCTDGTALPMLSTFDGENCGFGEAGWNTVASGFYFAPGFFDISSTGWPTWDIVNAAFNWNSAWPLTDTDISFDSDTTWIGDTPSGKGYVAAASPWFYTHYGVDTYNKNWIYRPDDWLLANRWEELVTNRDLVDMVEVVTWNDYSESSYVTGIKGSLPLNSDEWVTGYDHTSWLKMMSYYITAYKTGTYPAITKDEIYLWGRLYPKAAVATLDTVPIPTNADWTTDTLWAVIFAESSGSATISCGSQTTSANLSAGVNKLSLPLTTTCQVEATISRNGAVVTTFTPTGMEFTTVAPAYLNFNAFVASNV
ncbi:glycoside hydrolase [Stereum hirsutum FP-91666 SS1]|uniref:Glycoside hydrolase n=1 Tax=Stereum hirsutum (strain FP-91666) TaxID=721885 RepID=R7RXX0_STEHR|nr:glycoside hydrolase [Stereum hirsutum FP-91666 SS1]EIM79643.1 glycoside hydrolase [Stereum hirsutum FP-91666 SS1]